MEHAESLDWAGVALVITAISSAVVSLVTLWRVGRVHTAIGDVKTDVATIEKATNSMKDALVEATQKAGEAKGRDDERARREKVDLSTA